MALCALLLEQLGHHDDALPYLQAMGMRQRLSREVWDAGMHPPREHKAGAGGKGSADEVPPVRLVKSAVPPALMEKLLKVFAPGATFWKETCYEHRGYYSFYYPLHRPPSNVVAALIQHLRGCLPPDVAARVVGAEWWVHTRPVGRNLGHQMHFDTEETVLNTTGRVAHPVVSSVVYLSGGAAAGGATLVLDQRLRDPPASRGWLAHPVDSALLLFPGDRLHCVLPGGGAPQDADSGGKRDPSSSSSSSSSSVTTTQSPRDGPLGTKAQPAVAPTHRLTLMVGWWAEDVSSQGRRHLYGPCGPMPDELLAAAQARGATIASADPATASELWAAQAATWPRELAWEGSAAGAAAPTKKSPTPAAEAPVVEVAPVWEDIPPAPAGLPIPRVAPPKEIDLQFFVEDPNVFRKSVETAVTVATAAATAAANESQSHGSQP